MRQAVLEAKFLRILTPIPLCRTTNLAVGGVCPVLCLPPNPTKCYRASGYRWKALLDVASVALGRNSSLSMQVVEFSCGQSLQAGGRRFESCTAHHSTP